MSVRNIQCCMCGTAFQTKSGVAKYCNDECKRKAGNMLQNKKHNENHMKTALGDELVECLICNNNYGTLMSHLSRIHGIGVYEYRNMHPNAKIVSVSYSRLQSENNSGEKNPGFQHGGRLSPWSNKSEFHDSKTIEQTKQKAKDNRPPERRPTNIEYYLAQGMNQEESAKALSSRQTTFNLQICIDKHGEEEGKIVHANRQEKWLGSYKKSNYSKISQELFWGIHEHIETNFKIGDILFATINNGCKDDSKNHEHTLKLDGMVFKPDFIILSEKFIIEFDGDYWHSKEGVKEREEIRDASLKENGYTVIRVQERDFRTNKESIINECVKMIMEEHVVTQ